MKKALSHSICTIVEYEDGSIKEQSSLDASGNKVETREVISGSETFSQSLIVTADGSTTEATITFKAGLKHSRTVTTDVKGTLVVNEKTIKATGDTESLYQVTESTGSEFVQAFTITGNQTSSLHRSVSVDDKGNRTVEERTFPDKSGKEYRDKQTFDQHGQRMF